VLQKRRIIMAYREALDEWFERSGELLEELESQGVSGNSQTLKDTTLPGQLAVEQSVEQLPSAA